MGRHAHGGHANVMHGRDAATHGETAESCAREVHLSATHNEQGNARGRDGGQKRKQNRGPVVLHGNGQAEGEHADVVHGPDAEAHGNGATVEPEGSGEAARSSYSSCQIEGGIGGEDGDDHGQNYESKIVASHDHDFGCCH